MQQGTIYVCDSTEQAQSFLVPWLEAAGHQVALYNNAQQLMDLPKGHNAEYPDLVFIDDQLPGAPLDDLLKRLVISYPRATLVVVSALATVRKAVSAMQAGAHEYLIKPLGSNDVAAIVGRVLERSRLEKENHSLKAALKDRFDPGQIIFKSKCFEQVYTLACKVADSDASVLVLGESGTGKELIASTIHYSSPRRDHRFLTINCAALTDTLLESQLFGHVKGAFTGAIASQGGLVQEAHRGTLFLDEVGDLSPALQAKLLRVLQEKEYIPVGSTQVKHADVRFVAATNKDLKEEVAAGRFRQDLYYRINVATLKLPPLRERREDIPLLVRFFLRKQEGRELEIEAAALKRLVQYEWPGNVRELQNVLEMAALLADDGLIKSSHLPLSIIDGGTTAFSLPGQQISLAELEQLYIEQVFRQTRYHKMKTSEILKISRKTLDRKLELYAIGKPEK